MPADVFLTAVEQQGLSAIRMHLRRGNALVEQWFELHASTAEGPAATPAWRTEISQASGCSRSVNEQTDKHIPQGNSLVVEWS